MQTYLYGLWLLTFGVVLINSRFVFRSADNEQDGTMSYPNNYFNRLGDSKKVLNNLFDLDQHDGRLNNEMIAFERLKKEIEKGDPREFMG